MAYMDYLNCYCYTSYYLYEAGHEDFLAVFSQPFTSHKWRS